MKNILNSHTWTASEAYYIEYTLGFTLSSRRCTYGTEIRMSWLGKLNEVQKFSENKGDWETILNKEMVKYGIEESDISNMSKDNF